MATAALGMLPAWQALAADEPHDDPSSEGTVGLLTLPRANTLGSGQVAFGIFYETLAREEGSSNVERGGLTAAYGLTDRFELFTSFEPRSGVRRDFLVEDALGIPHQSAPRLNDHPFATDNFDSGLGDLRVGGKLKLLGEARDYSGLAIGAVVKIPTADDSHGIGTGKVDVGADLIASVEAGGTAGFNGRLGLTMKGDPDAFAIGNELQWGVGLQIPTRSWLSGIVETYGVRYVSQPDVSPVGFDNYTILQGGLRLSFGNGLAISGGVNHNLSIKDRFGVEPEKIGSFLQVSLSARHKPAPPPPPPPPPPVNQPPTISCRAEATSVRQGESLRVVAEARDTDGDTVTLRWSASVGSVTPANAASATWSSAGVSAGTASITVTVSDGVNASVTCSVQVRVEAAPAPAVATVHRFVCDAFAARSARIDNRCKAVLDDVALQLRANPRSTVRITGYDDANERTQSLATQRGENAKAYLTNTHLIDAVRSTVTSGTERERKVEIELTIP